MKLEFTMSERDKKLLIFLGVFVILVCFGYWGIRPILKSVTNIKEQIEDDKDVKAMNDLKLSELPMLQVDNEKMEENIETARGNYFSIMTSDEIDRFFTDMALSHNLYAYDLTIKMPSKTSDLEPYQYSEKALKPTKKEETDTDDEEDEDTDSTTSLDDYEEVDNGIYAVTVTMRLGGTQEELTRLVNELSNTEQKLRVCKYSYTKQKDIQTGEDGTYEVIENVVLNMTVELYMCEE